MKKLIIGNWKMNPQSQKEAEILLKGIASGTASVKGVDVVACVPFPFFSAIKNARAKKIILGAQDLFYEQKGPYTGEVSGPMLQSSGASFVIVGHSERRAMGETDEVINKKLMASLKAGLTPILCVGETARAHDGSYLGIVKAQLVACLANAKGAQLKNIVIAYEPVWSISSTENHHDATPHDFEEMKIYIKKTLTDLFSVQAAASARIIYGGSANKDNAEEFLRAGADGLLVGKASLDPKNFSTMVAIAGTVK